MAEKRRGLGRGLGALISGTPSTEEETLPKDSLDSAGSPSGGEPSSTAGIPQEIPQPSSSDDQSVSRETTKQPSAPKVSRETKKKPKDTESTRTAKVAEAKGSAPKAGQASQLKDEVRPNSKNASRKSRPVDMFFDSGTRDASTENDEPDLSSSNRAANNLRGRRVAVPDVLGQVMQQKDERTAPEAVASDVSAESLPSEVTQTLPTTEGDDQNSKEANVSRETLVTVPGASFAEVSVGAIHPNRKQPRTAFDEDDMAELVHSIREVGLLQPIVVRPSNEDSGELYELVMGERRWRAVQVAGLATIPAIIRNTSNTDLLRDALLENLHRSQLNPLEEAAAYQQLMQEFECTQDELSERIGRSRPQISNTIRLMKLPALVQRRVAAGILSAGHARALLGLADNAEMERLAQRIVNEGLSVRATEEIVAMNDGLRRPAREKAPRSTARHERLDYLANSLSDQLDTSVKITLGAKKGRVSIEFGSVDDLNRIMSVISPKSEN